VTALVLLLASAYVFQTAKTARQDRVEDRKLAADIAAAQVEVAKALAVLGAKLDALPGQLRSVLLEIRDHRSK